MTADTKTKIGRTEQFVLDTVKRITDDDNDRNPGVVPISYLGYEYWLERHEREHGQLPTQGAGPFAAERDLPRWPHWPADFIYTPSYPRSRYEAVRRAVASLAEHDLLCRSYLVAERTPHSLLGIRPREAREIAVVWLPEAGESASYDLDTVERLASFAPQAGDARP